MQSINEYRTKAIDHVSKKHKTSKRSINKILKRVPNNPSESTLYHAVNNWTIEFYNRDIQKKYGYTKCRTNTTNQVHNTVNRQVLEAI